MRETCVQAPLTSFLPLSQLAHVLPTEENFLLLFRCQQLKSCEEFMKVGRPLPPSGVFRHLRGGTLWPFLTCLVFLIQNYFQTWRKYDTDHSGFIETEELKVSKEKCVHFSLSNTTMSFVVVFFFFLNFPQKKLMLSNGTFSPTLPHG